MVIRMVVVGTVCNRYLVGFVETYWNIFRQMLGLYPEEVLRMRSPAISARTEKREHGRRIAEVPRRLRAITSN